MRTTCVHRAAELPSIEVGLTEDHTTNCCVETAALVLRHTLTRSRRFVGSVYEPGAHKALDLSRRKEALARAQVVATIGERPKITTLRALRSVAKDPAEAGSLFRSYRFRHSDCHLYSGAARSWSLLVFIVAIQFFSSCLLKVIALGSMATYLVPIPRKPPTLTMYALIVFVSVRTTS